MDLILRNGNLPDGRVGMDLGIENGRIVALTQRLEAAALREIDATGKLISPPFVDAHFHLDSALTYGQPRVNQSGTLLEGIALWAELKPTLSIDRMVDRALRYCELAISQGLLAIRSHVDTSDTRLLGVEALLEVQQKVAPWLDLQLVAFPQDGLYRNRDGEHNLLRALDMGVNVVGGIPHFERTMQDGTRSVTRLLEIAADRGLRADLHCDESDDPHSRHVETLAAETLRFGLQNMVAGSHLTSMHSMDNYYVSKLLPLMAESGVAAIANPLINITLQGRHDTYPKRRGMTRVPELLAAGVPVAFGHDCVLDPWYAFGSGDMLEVAHMGIHVGQMTAQSAIQQAFEAVTTTPARILGLTEYGLAVGKSADLLLLDAENVFHAIRKRADRLLVLRRGQILLEQAPRTAKVNVHW